MFFAEPRTFCAVLSQEVYVQSWKKLLRSFPPTCCSSSLRWTSRWSASHEKVLVEKFFVRVRDFLAVLVLRFFRRWSPRLLALFSGGLKRNGSCYLCLQVICFLCPGTSCLPFGRTPRGPESNQKQTLHRGTSVSCPYRVRECTQLKKNFQVRPDQIISFEVTRGTLIISPVEHWSTFAAKRLLYSYSYATRPLCVYSYMTALLLALTLVCRSLSDPHGGRV